MTGQTAWGYRTMLAYARRSARGWVLVLLVTILSTAAAWITYAIGRDLIDRTAGLVAAALQAFCPAIVMLVHGYVFSDHVDIAFLFWSELGIWLVVRAMLEKESALRLWTYVILAGVAQGLAFLSKSYPALIIIGVAAGAWAVVTRAGISR